MQARNANVTNYLFSSIHVHWFIIVTIVCEVHFSCCCMVDTNIAVKNAFILCDNNASCGAKCYRDYIIPSDYTEEFYGYQNGVWKPIASACKRNRFVDIRRCSTVIMLQYCNATQKFSWCYRERILQYLPGVSSKCYRNVYLFNGWLRGVFEFKFKTNLFCPFFLIVSL